MPSLLIPRRCPGNIPWFWQDRKSKRNSHGAVSENAKLRSPSGDRPLARPPRMHVYGRAKHRNALSLAFAWTERMLSHRLSRSSCKFIPEAIWLTCTRAFLGTYSRRSTAERKSLSKFCTVRFHERLLPHRIWKRVRGIRKRALRGTGPRCRDGVSRKNRENRNQSPIDDFRVFSRVSCSGKYTLHLLNGENCFSLLRSPRSRFTRCGPPIPWIEPDLRPGGHLRRHYSHIHISRASPSLTSKPPPGPDFPQLLPAETNNGETFRPVTDAELSAFLAFPLLTDRNLALSERNRQMMMSKYAEWIVEEDAYVAEAARLQSLQKTKVEATETATFRSLAIDWTAFAVALPIDYRHVPASVSRLRERISLAEKDSVLQRFSPE